MKSLTKKFRYLALFSYLALLGWVIAWHFLLTDSQQYSVLFLLIMWVIPLLLPLKGILAAKPYTHAWANFILMFYLLHGLTASYTLNQERLYAVIETLLTLFAFIGCSFFARLRGKELGLGLKKAAQKSE